ncbi:MAG: D-glycero-beta-D-manno-heptose 1-phosphate adenylyltransferase [Candidatus Lernaella stagnicola]|nr:D-glycero-beta-D-manno-heptose 1-phosphate adenylyltransferase [Candidatus Lernaella stagnicola]
MNDPERKIHSLETLLPLLAEHRKNGEQIVFTNGCFDILHVGHVRLLGLARATGDRLVVAINSDASVRRLNKGENRPIHGQSERAELLAAFAAVDYVTVFEEDTPLAIIEQIKPEVLVKGGDWGPDQIVGRDVVEANGGRVVRIPLVEGKSTTNIVREIQRD